MQPDPRLPAFATPNVLLSSALAAVCGLALGAGVNLGGVYLEHNGPRIGPLAFNGNGAIIVPCGVGPLLLVLGIVLLARRQAWAALVVYIIAFIAGFMGVNFILHPVPATVNLTVLHLRVR